MDLSDSLNGAGGAVILRHGPSACAIAPAAGGAVAGWVTDTAGGPVNLMRRGRTGAVAGGPAFDLSCFPLVPFSNRVDRGRFRFGARAVELPVDRWNHPHAIHGHGWEAVWTVEEQDGDSLRIGYRHPAGAWPWPYRAEQTFRLTPDSLSITIAITNEGDEPMPAGLGLHPYFPRPPGTVLTARTGGVWTNGPSRLPERRDTVPPAWDTSRGLCLDGVDIDHGFFGWTGDAVVSWPNPPHGTADGFMPWGMSLSVEADPLFSHLLIYSPPDEEYVCVEPVSHMTNALNRMKEPGAGICVLFPGNHLSGCVTFRVNRNIPLVC